jgi:hypothetical protein
MDIVEKLRDHALPDSHDEREVLHVHLLHEAANEIERLHELFCLLLQIQGEIHPGWNDEYIPAKWVFDISLKALFPNVASTNQLERMRAPQEQ